MLKKENCFWKQNILVWFFKIILSLRVYHDPYG